MDSKWKIKRLDEIAYNATSRFEVKNKVEAIFINTGDVYKGQFLHHDFSSIFEMPGQAKKAISNDDILYSEIRPGNKRYCYVNLSNPEDYVISTKFMIIRTKEDILPKYLYLILTSSYCENEFKLTAESRSGTFPQITFDSVGYYPIKYPDKHTQQKIVSFIKSLDQKITLNNQINETLEAMAQAIFKSWFIDFEPVKAKIKAKEAGQDAEGILLAAMSAISGKDSKALKTLQTTAPEEYAELKAIAEQFPDNLEESELGMIPKGWGLKPLDEIAEYYNGLALQKFRPDDPNDYLPIVKIAELRSGKANHEEKASPDIRENSIINDGDVIFSWSGTLLVDIWCGGKAALNQHLFKVVSENYPKWFFYFYTKYHLSNFQKIANDKAVTMGHIKRSHLKEALCLIPTSKFLMIDIIDNLLKHKVDNTLSNKTLTELRDTLLPKLLSGEIDVSNVEIM